MSGPAPNANERRARLPTPQAPAPFKVRFRKQLGCNSAPSNEPVHHNNFNGLPCVWASGPHADTQFDTTEADAHVTKGLANVFEQWSS